MAYEKQGVYLPEFEHDNCGAGFICSLNGEKTNSGGVITPVFKNPIQTNTQL